MIYPILADLALVGHLAFIVFVGAGGLLVARWPRLAWLHLPAAAWGALVEIAGITCPLTPLENRFRLLAGEVGYAGDFIGHYLSALIYPAGLTRPMQIGLGLLAVVINLAVYAWVVRCLRRNRKTSR